MKKSMIPTDRIVMKKQGVRRRRGIYFERKLEEVLEKMKKYRDMEIKGENYYCRPQVAKRCFNLLQEVVSNECIDT